MYTADDAAGEERWICDEFYGLYCAGMDDSGTRFAVEREHRKGRVWRCDAGLLQRRPRGGKNAEGLNGCGSKVPCRSFSHGVRS